MLRINHARDQREGRRGKTIILDFGPDEQGWTGRNGLADLLEVAGNCIDYAKIWALSAATLPETYVRDIVRMYHDAGVNTFAGGLLFEYAYLQGEVDGLIALLRHAGVQGVEVSENYLALDDNERLSYIDQLSSAGLDVVYEFGRKHPDEPMDLDVLDDLVARVKGAGAHHVIVEQGEIDLLEQSQPGSTNVIKDKPWFDDIFIEIDSNRFPKQHGDLIAQFGPEVNLANVAPGHALRLEGLRRGLGRSIDYPFLQALVERGPIR